MKNIVRRSLAKVFLIPFLTAFSAVVQGSASSDHRLLRQLSGSVGTPSIAIPQIEKRPLPHASLGTSFFMRKDSRVDPAKKTSMCNGPLKEECDSAEGVSKGGVGDDKAAPSNSRDTSDDERDEGADHSDEEDAIFPLEG